MNINSCKVRQVASVDIIKANYNGDGINGYNVCVCVCVCVCAWVRARVYTAYNNYYRFERALTDFWPMIWQRVAIKKAGFVNDFSVNNVKSM